MPGHLLLLYRHVSTWAVERPHTTCFQGGGNLAVTALSTAIVQLHDHPSITCRVCWHPCTLSCMLASMHAVLLTPHSLYSHSTGQDQSKQGQQLQPVDMSAAVPSVHLPVFLQCFDITFIYEKYLLELRRNAFTDDKKCECTAAACLTCRHRRHGAAGAAGLLHPHSTRLQGCTTPLTGATLVSGAAGCRYES